MFTPQNLFTHCSAAEGIKMDYQTVARNAANQLARCGFYKTDEIAEIITETIFWQNEVDPVWLRGEIEKALRMKRADEQSWPAITDCDRLDAVFDALVENNNVLALQNAGYTQSNGMDDVSQFYHEAGGEQSGIEGYCFITGRILSESWKVVSCG